MKRAFYITSVSLIIALAAFVLLSSRFAGVTSIANSAPEPSAEKPRKTLRAFTSAQELKDYFAKVARDQRGRQAETNSAGNADTMTDASPANEPAAKAGKDDAKDGESITNTQHAGVDEGGIVKLHGDHLVILR